MKYIIDFFNSSFTEKNNFIIRSKFSKDYLIIPNLFISDDLDKLIINFIEYNYAIYGESADLLKFYHNNINSFNIIKYNESAYENLITKGLTIRDNTTININFFCNQNNENINEYYCKIDVKDKLLNKIKLYNLLR